jgi:hypothetical protein
LVAENYVEVDTLLAGIRKVKMPADEYERAAREEKQKFDEVIQKDLAAGLNAEVRGRQERLQLLAVNLHGGMTVTDVFKLMGSPDRLESVIQDPHIRGTEYVRSLEEAASDAVLCISYWPRTGLPFDGRNGQGYKVLYVQFDSQRKLERSLWHQPEPSYAGSPSMLSRLERFWKGAYESSPPPPEEAGAY